jgi:hypothetical protein
MPHRILMSCAVAWGCLLAAGLELLHAGPPTGTHVQPCPHCAAGHHHHGQNHSTGRGYWQGYQGAYRHWVLGQHVAEWHAARRAYYNATDGTAPFGPTIRGPRDTQIANGLAERMTLYAYDFQPIESATAEQLNVYGVRRLQQLAPILSAHACELRIAPSGNVEVDEARKVQVIAQLAEMGTPIPPDAVIIREPGTRALDGIEAEMIYLQMLSEYGGGALGAGDANSGSFLPIPVTPTQQ